MTDTFGHWVPLAPVIIMVSVVIMNYVFMAQRNERKTATEASRLSAALIAELLAMLEIYRMNLELLAQTAKYLLSTRSSMAIYKGNINRLTGLLDGVVIKHVITAFAQNERIEGLVAAHSNLRCNLTYQFSSAEIDFSRLTQMYEHAAEQIAITCQILEQEARLPEALSDFKPWAALDRYFKPAPHTDERSLLVAPCSASVQAS